MANNIHAQMSYETAVYKEQLRLLQKEIERINLTTIDLSNATSTVQQLQQEDVLTPIGGGAFIKASVYNTNILVPVGAGYLIEMDKEYAVSEINKRIEATKKAIEKLSGEFQKVSSKLRELNAKLREMQVQDAINKRVDENIGEDYV